MAIGCHDDIRRLDVAVHDALFVSGLQSIGELHTELENVWDSQRSRVELLLERDAFDVLHRDERSAVDFADFVDLADIRMIESGYRLGFRQEALARLRVLLQ